MKNKGSDFWNTESGQAIRSAGSGLLAAFRAFGAALWKIIVTTWRLATALDSALWRAFLLISRRIGFVLGLAGSAIGTAVASLMAWLPTRWGRAYSAVFASAAMIAVLWGVDEIRNAARSQFADRTDGPPPVDLADPILARIDGRYIHLSEIVSSARASGVLAANETLSVAAAFERNMVESYVEQRLLARAAQDSGLHRAPVILRRMNAARDRVLAAAYVEQQTERVVTPETVSKLYVAQKDVTVLGDEINARHILVESEDEATEIKALLTEGAAFADLARERSRDPGNASLGGEIGWVTRDMLPYAFARAIFDAEPGSTTDPFESEFGWHIVEIHARRTTNSVPLESVRDEIAQYLRLRTIEDSISNLEQERQVIYFRPEVPVADEDVEKSAHADIKE